MKNRIAFWVTCVCLVCCIAFTALHTHATLNQLTQSATDDLLRICRMSAVYLDNAAFSPSEEKAAIRSLANKLDVGMNVLDAEGKAVATTQSSASTDVQGTKEIKAAFSAFNGEGTAQRVYKGVDSIFAACRLKNGGVVQIWYDAPTMGTVLGYVSGRTLLMAALLVALCIALVMAIVAPSEQLVESIKSVMFAFAEGRYEERVAVKGNAGYSTAVNEINEAARRIEERLIHQNRRTQAMSAVLNQSQNGMLAVDENMRITLATSTAKRLLGIRGNCDGLPLEDASKDVELVEVFEEAMKQDGVSNIPVDARSSLTGVVTPLQLYISPLRQDKQVTGAVAMVEDVTELRRLERVRTDFAANVSHELKTPLTSIKGFVETLLEGGAIDNPVMARKFLRIIMMEAERLTRLINDILSITKMESGQNEVSNQRIQLDQMADDIVEMLSIHAAEKQIEVSCNQPKEPLYIWGNPDRVEQMLMNLVENAIKYNQPGGTVRVSVYDTNDKIQLLVSDTGIGIDEKHIPRLFERFYRVDKGRSRSMGGTGLGLAIVKHIVVSMGGMIEVHSKLGEGTEFLVTLPKYENPAPAAQEEEI